MPVCLRNNFGIFCDRYTRFQDGKTQEENEAGERRPGSSTFKTHEGDEMETDVPTGWLGGGVGAGDVGGGVLVEEWRIL